ncbi:hypothetical protein CGCSCA5_v011753 [Colletotrichum siamense]|nr:hypothetical protein CGCSCA5_v011753 [Colletotrichum siamense]
MRRRSTSRDITTKAVGGESGINRKSFSLPRTVVVSLPASNNSPYNTTGTRSTRSARRRKKSSSLLWTSMIPRRSSAWNSVFFAKRMT